MQSNRMDAITEAFNNLLESETHNRSTGASSNLYHDNDNDNYNDILDDDESSVVALVYRQGYLCAALAEIMNLDDVDVDVDVDVDIEGDKGSAGDICAIEGNSTGKRLKSLRDVLGDQASSLGPLLGPLLQDRVDRQALMPATQDVDANEEVLDPSVNARTLTLVAVQAAWLYARVLSLPGALGSGLVDLEWLTALTAVVRRWSLECCGREQELVNGTPYSTSVHSPTKSPPKKRSRSNQSPQSDSDDEQEGLSNNVLKLGLQVAWAICGIPMHREFAAWSFEAREAILDAVSASLGTVAALQSALQQTQEHPTCCRIISKASTAFKASLTHARSGKSDATRQHETAVLILRGMLHLLQFKEILPNGEKGKLDAHTAASEILHTLMVSFHQSSIAASLASRSSLADATNQQTPSRRRRRSGGGLMTPATTINGKTPGGRRRRTSIEAPGHYGGKTPLLSPALKGRRSSMGCVVMTPALHFKPRPVWSVFVGLLQKLATTKGLERASARGPTVDALVQCVPALPLAERAHFLRYLLKLAKSKVSLHRLVACELLGRFLAEDWVSTHQDDIVATEAATASSPTPETPNSESSHQDEGMQLTIALWKALQGRLLDKLAAVRARAAASVETATTVHPDWLDESLLESLRKRALRDETATVRKAALLALKQVLLSQPEFLSEQYIATFCEVCHDSSLLTRRAAAESITSLLEAYLDHPTVGYLLEQAWSTCVLPMVMDEDVAPKAIASFDQVVISPILASIEKSSHDDSSKKALAAAWRLLAHVATVCSAQGASKGVRQALQTALHNMASQDSDRIYKHLWKEITRIAKTSLDDQETSEVQVIGVWCLLEAILLSAPSKKNITSMVQIVKKRSGNSILDDLCQSAWTNLLDRCHKTSRSWLQETLRSCLCVVAHLAPGLDEQTAEIIHTNLQEALRLLNFPPEVIGVAIKALAAVTVRLDSNDTTLCSQWIRSIYKSCEEEMTDSVKACGESSFPVDRQARLVRALFCVGELSMVGFRVDDDEKDFAKKNGRNNDKDILRGMHEKPSKKLQELVMILLPPDLPGLSIPRKTPTTIRAHAFTVLGKLALRDEHLAKNSLNLLARELHPSTLNPSPSVQSNALLVLGDLCVRYTNMADRYLPVMASCLQSGASDPEKNFLHSSSIASAVTRKHAVLLLSSLLLQDYIKWRGLLFHRFLVACSDENEEVAALAESVLSGPLSTRNPKLFFNHFVEALFVLNKCTAHPIYIAAANQGDGGSGIAVGFDGIYLNGELGRLRRRRMYEFLLSKLSDEEKIGVTARLAKEVLGEAVSSEGDLGRVCQMSNQDFGPKLQSAWNVLTDALSILTNKAIKVGKVQDEEDVVEDPNVPNPTRQVSMAKNRLLSKISRKHLIEIVLPILCNLKSKLQSSCSPLLKDLMTYLLDIFKAYKVEVKEFLANDPTLLQEIEYDARQYTIQNNCTDA